MEKPKYCVIGCGKLGTSLAWRLFGLGYPLAGLSSGGGDSARAAAGHLGTPLFFEDNGEASRQADLILITTPDDRISGVCEELSRAGGIREGAVVLHCSGSLSSDILASAREAGASAGSMHPLQSFPDPHQGVNLFEGILISVEGDPRAVDLAREVARDLGAVSADVKADSKTLYHAAAVVASNYLVALLDMAFALNQAAGINPSDSALGLMPLIKGTLGNIQAKGPANALTGPIVRGDVRTVASHLKKMKEKTPDLVPLYKALGRRTLGIARDKGALGDEAFQALMEELQD